MTPLRLIIVIIILCCVKFVLEDLSASDRVIIIVSEVAAILHIFL
jgi:hypothetical protein